MVRAIVESTTPEKETTMNMAEEAGKTIRGAITQWPRTLRLISILVAATVPATVIVLFVVLQNH
jgi:hypothetical protein